MPSKGDLIYHLTYLLYAPCLGKLQIMNLAANPLWFQLLCWK